MLTISGSVIKMRDASTVWNATSELIDKYGADTVLDEFVRYMSDDDLAACVMTFARLSDEDEIYNELEEEGYNE